MTEVGSIARAARILSALAEAPDGALLHEIVSATGFTKTTTHRVLGALQDVRFVAQEPASRRYRLAGGLSALSRTAMGQDLAAAASQAMQRLAALTEDTVFLSAPEGGASVCLSRVVGPFPIRTLTLDKGDRRPLGVGAGALALFASLDAPARKAVCKANGPWLAEYKADAQSLEAQATATIERGYALIRGAVIPGMSAIGAPICSGDGRAVAALAIGAIDDRMSDERIAKTLLPALRREIKSIEQQLAVFEGGRAA